MATQTAVRDEFQLDTIEIIWPDHYQKNGYPHREWAFLRKHRPVFWFDRPYVQPFWAITKHEDICNISRQPKLFINAPRLLVFTANDGPPDAQQLPFKHLLIMDPPQHGKYRGLVNTRFTPRAVRTLEAEIDRIAKGVLDGVTRRVLDGVAEIGECDFVTDVSAKVPLAVIAELLGVPHEDWELLFKWTNETIGAGDPEFHGDSTPEETALHARESLFAYFSNLVEKRRANPRDDLTSVVTHSKLDGGDLPFLDLLAYFFLLVVAGNETTRNATSGGLLAFIENPDQWQRLKQNPALIHSTAEEIVRWTTPVIQFARTATEDTEVRGQKIREGESVCLFYPSANRDEDIFEDPFKFDIGRDPNPHIAFGIGEHFCLGANLARLELEVIFRQLAQRLDHAELAGPVERLRSSFVGGVKHIPIRYRMRPAPN